MSYSILLVDSDSKLPNLAIMKLYSYFIKENYGIKFIQARLDGYNYKDKVVEIDNSSYDYTFVSTIFKCNKNKVKLSKNKGLYFGGSGENFKSLPPEIDSVDFNYDLYPTDTSVGFITRGCIRNCSFCIVPKKEGSIYLYRHPSQIIKHKQVEFFDNNILAYSKHLEILNWLVDHKIKYNFNQGLDLRLLTDENASLLSSSNYKGEYTFAFDSTNYLKLMDSKLPLLKKYFKDWQVRMFVLVGFDSAIKEDIFRIEWCRSHKILPYIMRHENCYYGENKTLYSNIAAYCNQPQFFKKMSPKEFILKRTSNFIEQFKFIHAFEYYK